MQIRCKLRPFFFFKKKKNKSDSRRAPGSGVLRLPAPHPEVSSRSNFKRVERDTGTRVITYDRVTKPSSDIM